MATNTGKVLPLLACLAGCTLASAQTVADSKLAASAPAAVDGSRPILLNPPTPDAAQSLRDEINRLTLEKDKIAAELAFGQAKLDKELAESKATAVRLQAQLAEKKAKQELAEFEQKQNQEKDLAALRQHFDKITLTSNIAKAEADQEVAEIRHVENGTKKEIARMWSEVELKKEEAESRNYALSPPVYLADPLQGRKLVLSDRRIPLNGVITMASADQIVDRINYFNNRDRTLPIFIVIDDSPGGSVMAGYKIIKAMNGSDAPVQVVVKSFAASMAACITTLAKRSYAYPNALILHHQIQAFSGGNLTQTQEWLKEMEEWWKRLAGPVAEKMGITRDDFIKQMYAHASSGDWHEFADNAQKLKWVDTVVDEIEETGTLKNPDTVAAPAAGPRASDQAAATGEMHDEKGRPYMNLPRLNPMDCYWLYNRDGYFRAP